MGFDLCEDLIDYTYDHIPDIDLKVKLFVDQVEYLCSLDAYDLYKRTESSRSHNQKNFLKIISKQPKHLDVLKNWFLVRNMPIRLSWK